MSLEINCLARTKMNSFISSDDLFHLNSMNSARIIKEATKIKFLNANVKAIKIRVVIIID